MNLLKIPLSFREKVLGIIIMFALVCFLFDYALYTPKKRQVQKIKNELESIDKKIRENFNNFSEPAGITRQISLLEDKSRFLKKSFSISVNPGRYIEEVAGLCHKLDIEILSLKPGETGVPNHNFRHVFVEMGMQCDYKTIVLFMKELASLTVINIVDSLKIQKDRDSGPLKFHLVIEAFFPNGKQQEISLPAKPLIRNPDFETG